MTLSPHEVAFRQTPAGKIAIRADCTPQTIRNLDFDTYFGINARQKSIFTRRVTLEARAADPDTNVVLAVTDARRIAGFGVFAPPDSEDRWSEMPQGTIKEIEVVEVHSDFRVFHIAGDMIRRMMMHPRIETIIAQFGIDND